MSKQSKWNHVDKHHAEILKALLRIVEKEPYDKTKNDEALAEAVRAEGIWATRNIIREIRLANGIGTSDARRITQFAKQCGKKK